ncbi:hypothetical protein CW304_18020 [Bacillus sp. UFRGS-B20]|nr:hypothetical protein CW304_18020 [Bacillus sp. UFRGS-B20]
MLLRYARMRRTWLFIALASCLSALHLFRLVLIAERLMATFKQTLYALHPVIHCLLTYMIASSALWGSQTGDGVC